MRGRSMGVVAVVAMGLVGGIACGAGDSGTEPATGSDAARGEALYADRCASCHGVDLKGTNRGPSHLSKVYEPSHHADGAFRAAIANGVRAHHWRFGDMPPVDGLSKADVDTIIDYVRNEQERRGFDPYPPR